MEKCLYFNGLNVFKDNLSYCIDMIRLSCKISSEKFERKIASRLIVYGEKINNWVSSRITDFYNNSNYIDDDCSFWFGFMFNREKLEGKKMGSLNTEFNLTVEFNPNKGKDNKLLLSILNVSNNWFIKSCDFAVDIPTNILNICGLDKGLKKCLMTYDCGGADKTYYIGKRDNRVKIYNKSIESGLSNDLTRIEITKSLNNLPVKEVSSYMYEGYFPELFINEYQISIDDCLGDKTLFAIVYAVSNGFPLHDLTRDYKKKVKEFLQNKKPIVIDFNGLSECLKKYIFYYFNT